MTIQQLNTYQESSISHLDGYDNSTINVSGGDISWLSVYDNNVTNISYVDDLSWLLVNDDAVVNIYGADFFYTNGHLNGAWANGSTFSFWAVEESELFVGNFGNDLPDNIILHSVSVSVPAPATFLLFAFSLLALSRRKLS